MDLRIVLPELATGRELHKEQKQASIQKESFKFTDDSRRGKYGMTGLRHVSGLHQFYGSQINLHPSV